MGSSSNASRSSTLVDLLQHRANRPSHENAFTFLEDGTAEMGSLTYQQLDLRARAIAAALQTTTTVGDRALLLYPPGLDFISAFFGCLYAGVVAVPAYPPRQNQKISRLLGIMASAQPTTILATSSIVAELEREPAQRLAFGATRWLATDRVLDDQASTWRKPAVGSDSLAFLQYTSGSTSAPKGVMVSHRNLLHNSECIRHVFALTRDSVSVTWLPSYHDMGLIDGILQPVYGGFPGYLMSPSAFLQQPIRWLQAISRYRATHSGGPNFAYALCVNKTTPEQREKLDLSCWAAAYNGAEPIRHDTLQRFTDTFEPCGFRSRFFYPCYGLAEATLMVSGGLVGEELVECSVLKSELEQHRVVDAPSSSEKTSRLVGCGRVHLGTRVVIADPESLRPCSPDRVGEIWVASPSVAAGYWRQPEKTEETFQAHLADTGEGPFLRTGDLGFLRGRELFVTGRLKDMFIVRGRNHYPQDIERTVEQTHPALRSGCGAAFTVAGEDAERLVVVQEVERGGLPGLDVHEVARAVRREIAAQHELQVHAVVLLATGTISKTSSGKIQRHACRAAYLDGTLVEVGRSALELEDEPVFAEVPDREALLALSSTELRRFLVDYLRQVLAQLLRIAPAGVDVHVPVLHLGVDSLGATELTHRLETDLGVVVPTVDLLREASVQDVAGRVAASLEGSTPGARVPPGVPSDEELEHPLSPGQQALWFLHQLAPQSAAYNVSFAVRIVSEVDVPALRGAFQLLSDRHPALRATVALVDGRPVQRVHRQVELDFGAVDAASWTSGELDGYLTESSSRAFDLREGPLMRVRLCARAPGEHILLLAAHHVVVDFWSLVLLMDELRVAYASLRARQPVRLPPLRRRPADFVRWQADLLASPAGDLQRAYWEKQLAGVESILNLPLDRPRPPVQTFRGGTRRFPLGTELTEQLRGLARSQGVTTYMLLLAAFQAQIHRYTGQADFCVGSSVDGRSRAEFSGTVGYFVNQLVMRADLSGSPTFRGFLDRGKRTVLEALANADLPFPLLVEHLRPERDPSRSPLFQVMFVFQKPHRLQALASLVAGTPGASLELGELKLESAPLEQRAAQFDLTLAVVDGREGLTACWEYDRDLFDEATVGRMNGHFRTLLAAVVEDPDQPVSTVALLSPDERSQLQLEWNRTGVSYPDDRCTHQLFEAQADRTPDTPAVVHADRILSYRELNARANQVADHLRQTGTGPGALVGIFMERSVEMVVAVIGTLKAGAAYVPLDPSQPAQRLAQMVDDAGVAVLFAQEHLLPKLPPSGARVICLDPERAPTAGSDPANPAGWVSPDDLAYVIYTSGSTGRPKGVMITHGAMVNYLRWCVGAYDVAGGSGAPVNSSISFDATITSLFSPLLVGGKVVLVPERQEMAALGDMLGSAEDFSLVKITPAHLELLKSHLPPDGSRLHTRALVVGGEALAPAAVEFWRTRAPGTRIINEYGPTETVVGCCVHDVTAGSFPSGVVPIGRPIANTTIYLLDGRLQPVPVAVTGELYVGGFGVARGYLGRPDLTAEKFIPDPFGATAGARLYRTGDLARYQPDGTIEFLGRADDQVKVRGFRVEPGEIEAALLRHPDVHEAAVAVHQDTLGNKRLVAYVVRRESPDPATPGELRHFLESSLPTYMVPSAIVPLQELPLTPNGKVDRRSLPEPDGARPGSAGACVPPSTETQRFIASVWREVLHLDDVGIHDNFFDLGGHSLLTAQVHQKLQDGLDRRLSIVDLLLFPTVGALARHLDQSGAGVPGYQPIHDRAERQRRAIDAQRKSMQRRRGPEPQEPGGTG